MQFINKLLEKERAKLLTKGHKQVENLDVLKREEPITTLHPDLIKGGDLTQTSLFTRFIVKVRNYFKGE